MSSSDDDYGESCEKLKRLCAANVNSGSANGGREFLRQLCGLISDWTGELPNLANIFRPPEIDWLLSEFVRSKRKPDGNEYSLVDFVIRTGYVDEFEPDGDGKPCSRRTTAVHRAASKQLYDCIPDLFKIYNRFDVNYVDEASGLTHFHAACASGALDVVQKFLELGQNPNCPSAKAVDAPLHLALRHGHTKVAELLMESGAFPNLIDEEGSTPLHVISQRYVDDDLAERFFRIVDDLLLTVQLDVRDESGDTPLHLALRYENKKTAETLLRRGADTNLPDAAGMTPLHSICEAGDAELLQLFFKIKEEKRQPVQIDAPDQRGRTPLQLAVANLWPNVVDVLLDRGADLSNFVLTIESHFDRDLEMFDFLKSELTLESTSGIFAIIECFEKRGYRLDRNDALATMKLFAKQGAFESFAKLESHWYEHEEFASKAREMSIVPGLSLYDFIRLRPEEATGRLACGDYFKFWRSGQLLKLPQEPREACIAHLCEILSREFCRRWAQDSLLTLTRHRLTALCCNLIIDESFVNQDLCRICLAAEVRSS